VPDGAGLGVEPDRDEIARFTTGVTEFAA
jgi:hypothetical protein